jgi:hypothetical protein
MITSADVLTMVLIINLQVASADSVDFTKKSSAYHHGIMYPKLVLTDSWMSILF